MIHRLFSPDYNGYIQPIVTTFHQIESALDENLPARVDEIRLDLFSPFHSFNKVNRFVLQYFLIETYPRRGFIIVKSDRPTSESNPRRGFMILFKKIK